MRAINVLGPVLLLFIVFAGQARGQELLESFSEYLPIADQDIPEIRDGDIVSLIDGKIRRADQEYDDNVFGVVSLKPAIGLSLLPGENNIPVASRGTASVNVSAANGAIASGDFIASSTVPGVGMKATRPGMVIGSALSPFEPSDTGEVGRVHLAIEKHFAVPAGSEDASQAITQQIRQALITGSQAARSDPNTALRYAIAALVMIISLLFGLLVFGRSATNGIVAVGRNPLARNTILAATSFNVFMTLAMVAGGVAAAFFILAL